MFRLQTKTSERIGEEQNRKNKNKMWFLHIFYQLGGWLALQRYVTHKWIRATVLMRK